MDKILQTLIAFTLDHASEMQAEIKNYPDELSMVQDFLQSNLDNGTITNFQNRALNYINEIIADTKNS